MYGLPLTERSMSEGVAKRILVTGASAGLGRAVALELASRGHRLALTARREDKLREVAEEALRRGAADAFVIRADLADPETPARLVNATVGRFQGLDVLVNNAGYGLPQYFASSDADELRKQIEVNLTAPIILAHCALPWVVASRGTIINIGSAITCVPNPVYGVYGTTKTGLAYWNDALRREVRHLGVHVCLVEPGPVATDFFDAVDLLAGQAGGCGIAPAPDSLYNAMRDRPPKIMTARVDDAARRIARLVEHPRRRLSFLKRMIWPWRALGVLFRVVPGLGDLAITHLVRRIERERARHAQMLQAKQK
jgi:short-subunit dehydrogenase